MHRNNHISTSKFSNRAKQQDALKTFLSVLAIVVSAKSARILLSRTRKRDEEKNRAIIDRAAVQIALFPALLPRVYSYVCRRFGTSSGLAELLSSPLLLLIPPSWRVQAALYATSSALYHSGRNSSWRRFLPPTWTLNVVGNAWLLWAFLFRSEAFPSAYEKVILSNSTHYVPPDMSKSELEDLLCSATFFKTSPNSSAQFDHAYELCTKLHPTEPSCLKNYLKAWLHESLRTYKWVGVFSALPILLSRPRRALLVKNPMLVLTSWLSSTLSGTAFIAGSINTSWAVTCLLQRILPKDRLTRARWLFNASVASLWILILPEKRRVEISLYVARLAVLCAWRAWRLGGGMSVPFGDVIMFALSWIQLARIQRGGEKISGLIGIGLAKIRQDRQ